MLLKSIEKEYMYSANISVDKHMSIYPLMIVQDSQLASCSLRQADVSGFCSSGASHFWR